MGIGTTVNIRRDIRVRLEAACEATGMSRSGIIVLLLRKVMTEHERLSRDPGSVRYQGRQERHMWRRISVTVKSGDYEYFLDMRRLFRRSVSLLVAYGVGMYLDVVVNELLNEIGSKRSLPQNNNEINSNVRGDYSKYNPNPRIQNQNQNEESRSSNIDISGAVDRKYKIVLTG